MPYSPIMLVGGKALPTGVLGRSIPLDTAFRLTITTPTDNFNVVIPLVGSGDVDRGDGTSGTFNGDYSYTPTPPLERMKLRFDNGNIDRVNFNNNATASMLMPLTEIAEFQRFHGLADQSGGIFRFCSNMR